MLIIHRRCLNYYANSVITYHIIEHNNEKMTEKDGIGNSPDETMIIDVSSKQILDSDLPMQNPFDNFPVSFINPCLS